MSDYWQKWREVIYSDKETPLTGEQFYEILNVLCNRVDASIVPQTKALAGYAYNGAKIRRLGKYGELFEAISKARSLAMDIKREHEKESI